MLLTGRPDEEETGEGDASDDGMNDLDGKVGASANTG